MLGEGDVADGSIEPDIQHLAVSTLNGYFDAPVEVAGDSTGLETSINPRLALSVDICLPVTFVLFENPFAQPRLILVKGEVPVLGLAHDGRIAAEGGLGINQVGSIEGGATGFALVAIGMLIAAMGAGAGDVAVGKELLSLLVIVLHRYLLDELALVIEFLEKGRSSLMVFRAGSAAVDVERDAQLGKRVLDNLVVTIHDVLWSNTLFAGFDGDRHAVLVTAANEHHLFALSAEITDIDVGGHIDAGQMADMDRAVSIRQCRSDGETFVMLVFLVVCHVVYCCL